MLHKKWLVIALFALLIPTNGTQAQKDSKSWWAARFRGPMATRVGKNHELVKNAFATAVSSANKATVRIYADDAQIALGVAIDEAGHVLTKASEIRDKSVQCKVSNGRYAASIVGINEDLDIALIKIQSGKLQFAKLHTGKTPTVGAWLAATGGVRDEPLAIGVVSVSARKIEQQSGVLGVMIDDAEDGGGAQVNDVIDDSAAEVAGVKVGDVIKMVDGQAISSSRDLIGRLSKKRPGTRVHLSVDRGEATRKLKARLGRFSDITMGEQMQAEVSGPLSQRRSGFSSAIQHDIVLRPNQCGGPIVDVDGRVVGINIARAGRVESYAVTSAAILQALPDLMSGKLAAR